MVRVFRNRAEAGTALAARLEHLRSDDVVVLGLPRGGVPVAFEIAEALDAPLDVIVVRKIGVPGQPELAMGAIGEDGVRVVNRRGRPPRRGLRCRLHPGRATRARGVAAAGRHGSAGPRHASTSSAAPQCSSTTASPPDRPHAPPAASLEHTARRRSCWRCPSLPRSPCTRCRKTPTRSSASSNHRGCAQSASRTRTSDRSTIKRSSTCSNEHIDDARRPRHDRVRTPAPSGAPVRCGPRGGGRRRRVGTAWPPDRPRRVRSAPSSSRTAAAAAATARGTSSSQGSSTRPAWRRSPSTCSPTPRRGDRRNVFDIGLLASRLTNATDWVRGQRVVADLPVALFGASTGAAAALVAASDRVVPGRCGRQPGWTTGPGG